MAKAANENNMTNSRKIGVLELSVKKMRRELEAVSATIEKYNQMMTISPRDNFRHRALKELIAGAEKHIQTLKKQKER